MDMDMETAREYVARGAALLDAKAAPGWRDAIDVQRLDIYSPQNCVLGQLARHSRRSYIKGADDYISATYAICDGPFAAAYGFNCDYVNVPVLTAAWRELLTPAPATVS